MNTVELNKFEFFNRLFFKDITKTNKHLSFFNKKVLYNDFDENKSTKIIAEIDLLLNETDEECYGFQIRIINVNVGEISTHRFLFRDYLSNTVRVNVSSIVKESEFIQKAHKEVMKEDILSYAWHYTH